MQDKRIWDYAEKHKIPYDTVIVAMEMVEENPKLDVFALMLTPTDEQIITMRCKLMG